MSGWLGFRCWTPLPGASDERNWSGSTRGCTALEARFSWPLGLVRVGWRSNFPFLELSSRSLHVSQSSTLGKPPPILTVGGVQNFIDKLKFDQNRVQNAPHISATDQQNALGLIASITSALSPLIQGLPPSQPMDMSTLVFWTGVLKQPFSALTAILVHIPSADPADGTSGACYYQGGCEQLPQSQCIGLGGCFVAGGSCTSPPPASCPS